MNKQSMVIYKGVMYKSGETYYSKEPTSSIRTIDYFDCSEPQNIEIYFKGFKGVLYSSLDYFHKYFKFVEDKQKPKIDAVIKYIYADTQWITGLTLGKFYTILPTVKQDDYYYIQNDDGYQIRVKRHEFISFKVGDKYIDIYNNVVTISEFEIDKNNDIIVSYKFKNSELRNSELSCPINQFDFISFKDASVKQEPELLPVGTKVIFNKGTFVGKPGEIKTIGLQHYVITIDYNQHGRGREDVSAYHDDVDKIKEPELLPVGTKIKVIKPIGTEGIFNQYIGKFGTINSLSLDSKYPYLIILDIFGLNSEPYYASWDSIEKIEEPELLPIGTAVMVHNPMSMFNWMEGTIIELSLLGNYLVALKSNQNIWFKPTSIQKLEKAKPKFEVGDKVRILSDAKRYQTDVSKHYNIKSAIGYIGTIKDIQNTDGIFYFYVKDLPKECLISHVDSFYYTIDQLELIPKNNKINIKTESQLNDKLVEKLTKNQAIILSGFTDVLCCQFGDFHEDVEKRLGHSVWSHQFASSDFSKEIKELYREDFMKMIEGL